MSLARKYRPSSFDAVIGQKAVVQACKQAVKANTQHSFLLTGPSGTGKTTLARIMANAFAGGEATAANIDEVAAADHTGVDAMRDVAQRALFRGMGASAVKAIILDECHRLSGNAWDVLLKPIEEPPAHVYWFLCTTEPGKVPKTILTRCARYDLKPVPEEAILELLCQVADEEGLKTPDEVIEAIAEGAGGSPRQALVFLESCGHLVSIADVRLAMRSGGQSKEAIDLCRFIIKPTGKNWAEAAKLVNIVLEGVDAESARIIIANYLGTALLGTKDDRKAVELFRLLEPFLKPFQTSDRAAPLLYAIGLALGLDQ